MKRSTLEIYAMIACLFLGMYGLMIVSSTVSDILFLANPAWEMTESDDNQYVSNDAFCTKNFGACSDTGNMDTMNINTSYASQDEAKKATEAQAKLFEQQEQARKEKYSPEAITAKRMEAFEFEKNIKHQRTLMALLYNIIELGIVSGLFFVHWQIGRKARAASIRES